MLPGTMIVPVRYTYADPLLILIQESAIRGFLISTKTGLAGNKNVDFSQLLC